MLEDDPLWYKDAVIYELHVRAFSDSVGDGYGDFRGLTDKLDYLQDLGVSAIWLLPFYPSPLRDDGYDIADYTNVHPNYGQLRDFQEFLNSAHRHGLRVITELVVNHTSDQHPWFQRARRAAPGTPERDFYVWSDTPQRYTDARIIFQDFEHSNWAWDHVAQAYYWHRFYSHQPDLNFDNPAVWRALLPVVDFWLGMGVDGMRLDAIPYLFEREGTSCENLPETHGFLRELRRHVDQRFANRMLLAEANQWPEDAVAYFGGGEECHMAFHFPLMPRLFMAIHQEDRFPIIDILSQTPPIPETCQWCVFLRNHDELTLEMVTDEERDYMYGAYAAEPRARINLGIRRRLAPLLGNNRRRIELMNGLLFSMPGTPVIYYGDEIGMGDNIYLGDRNGVRTPMQWSADRNAGFSRANPQQLYLPVIIDPEYHYESINVEAQQNNPNSLLWWMKRLIALRKRYRAFGRGTVEMLHPANRAVLAFLRRYQDECVLVVANLSRFVQHVELDLGSLEGHVPVEMFGRSALPRIGRQPYSLTLGPHSFYWLAIEAPVEAASAALRSASETPVVVWPPESPALFDEPIHDRLEAALGAYLDRLRSHPGSKRTKPAVIQHLWSFPGRANEVALALVDFEFDHRMPQRFLIPLAFASGQAAEQVMQPHPDAVIARVRGKEAGILYDGLRSEPLRRLLLESILDGQTYPWPGGTLVGTTFLSPEQRSQIDLDICARPMRQDEQTNTSLVCGDRVMLKVFFRVESGPHPEVELGRFLTEKAGFTHGAPVLGTLELRLKRQEPVTLAVLHEFVPNEGTAWQFTLDDVSRYFERVLSLPAEQSPPARPADPLALASWPEAGPVAVDLLGRYLEAASLLGRRTAEMHRALASDPEHPTLAPEPVTQLYQRSLYQSMRHLQRRGLETLATHRDSLPAGDAALAERVLAQSEAILGWFQPLLKQRYGGQRIRCHGDYTLWEVLFTGKDFVIVDFEGDPRRSVGDRRIKRSPLRDVATMMRSFDYAVTLPLLPGGAPYRGRTPGLIRDEDLSRLRPWAGFWLDNVWRAFWSSYLETAAGARFLPAERAQTHELLGVFLLERTLHELAFDLQHRQSWAPIPVRALARMLEAPPAAPRGDESV